MKLEEGMYVRTEIGRITKLNRKVHDITDYYFDCFECDNYINDDGDNFICECEILKASYNIIDLIEVGDYVNGYMVRGTSVSTLLLDNFNMIQIDEEDIKSIVTKEEFESMSYKIGRG